MATKTKSGKTILIPADDSEHANFALEWYAHNLHKPDASVILAYFPDMSEKINTAYASAGRQAMLEMVIKGEDEVDFVLKRLAKKLEELNLPGRVERLSGKSAGQAIIKAAEDLGVTCIVMGSRGRGTLSRAVLGSVSQYVVHHSAVPVVVCNKDKP